MKNAGPTRNRDARRPPQSALRLSVHYATDLSLAYFLAAIDAVAILIPLRGHTAAAVNDDFAEQNTGLVALLILLGIVIVAIGGPMLLAPTLRWYSTGQPPTAEQREATMKLGSRQSALLTAVWVVCGSVLILLNTDRGPELLIPIVLGVVLGGTAAAGTGLLLAQRTLRPIMTAATRGREPRLTVPGVFARMVLLWFLCSAIPFGVIVACIALRSYGWLIDKSASLDVPVLVVSLAALVLGLPTMILTSRSVSDPIGEVADAMAEIEHGRLGTYVGVYERSQIGRLQAGFNRMAAGLEEREKLRDLFGRHVGTDVARRALEEGASLSGEVVEAAVLFIDLVGSTRLAESLAPEKVAEVLNDFFQIVVGTVDEYQGSINKFEGDAALVIFGAPLRTDEPASSALATARALGAKLRELPVVDFGIGVSAGRVFAGNIGAENRYEYTVIGDPVNEAARLADLAKTYDQRMLCSEAAIRRAGDDERARWSDGDATVLRGRSEPTRICAPTGTG